MAKIHKQEIYSLDTIVTLDDYLIGTDNDSPIKKTKNYSIRGILNLLLANGNSSVQTGVVSGSVYWLQDLDFASTQIDYVFNNTFFQTPVQTFTLSNADATNNRIDVFAIDITTNTVVVIEGVPSANPQEPTVDFTNQIRLSAVIVEANATTAQGLSSEQVYNENLGEPNEWTVQTNIPISGTINADYSLDASLDTKSIFFEDSNAENLNSISFTNDVAVNPSNINFDFKALNFDGILYVSLSDNNGNQVGTPVTITNNTFGIDFNSTNYETVSLPISSFGSIVGDIYSITITVLPFTIVNSFLIDNVLIQNGLNPIGNNANTFLSLIDTFNDYVGRGFQILRVNKSGTGVDSVDLDDLLSDVAFSGSYNDLIDLPTIPQAVTNTSDLVNDGENGSSPFIELDDLEDQGGQLIYLDRSNSGKGLVIRNVSRLGLPDIGSNAIDLGLESSNNSITGTYSFGVGNGLEVSGTGATAIGSTLISKNDHETALGEWNTNYPKENNDEARVLSVGVGSVGNLGNPDLNRKDAWSLFKNGAHKFFSAALSTITNTVKTGFVMLDETFRLNIHNGTEWRGLVFQDETYNILPTKYASLASLETAYPVASVDEFTVAFIDDDSGRYWMKVGTQYIGYAPLNQPKQGIVRTTSFTVSASMHNEYIECTNATAISATIPVNATTPIDIGTYLTISQDGDGIVNIEGETGVTLLFEDGYISSTRAKNTVLMARKKATDTWLIFGALKTA